MNDGYDFPPVYNKKLAAAEKDACFLASSEHSRAERRLFRKYRFLLPEEVLRVVLIIACVVGAFFYWAIYYIVSQIGEMKHYLRSRCFVYL